MPTMPARRIDNLWPTMLAAGLLVGTLDLSCALIYYTINTHKDPIRVFYFIASAVFGPQAYNGGAAMVAAGALMHYMVAIAFTLFFFLIYPRLRFLSRNTVLTGILYGLFAWSVMNLIVLPLLQVHGSPKPRDIIINMLILIAAIGLPLSFIARRFYGQREVSG